MTESDPKYRPVRDATEGIVFGCHPHGGPSFNMYLRSFIHANGGNISNFHFNRLDPILEMNNYFVAHVQDIFILTFWETQGVYIHTHV